MLTGGHPGEDSGQIKLSITEHLFPYFSSSFFIYYCYYYLVFKEKDTFGKITRFVKTISLNIRT